MLLKKIIWWIPTILFWIVFGIILLVFHVLQVVARRFSETAHTYVVTGMVWTLNQALWIVGNRISYYNLDYSELDIDHPIILVSNHQCMFDIPAIHWAFRKFRPKFIAKKSLGKGIPAISYNIRHGGNATISLTDGRSALRAIDTFGKQVNALGYMAVIFPEGARARDGKMFPFKALGLLKLLQTMPEAKVVPVALHNFWKFERWVCKPIPFGTHMQLHMLPVIDRSISDKEVIKLAEAAIAQKLNQLNS